MRSTVSAGAGGIVRARIVRTSALAAAVGVLLGSATAVLPVTVPAGPTPAAAAEAGQTVDCPRASVPDAPAAPTAEPVDPSAAPVGGEAMGTTGLATPEGAPAVPTDISAASWVVADLDTGDVLGACAPHVRSKPASTLKLLTAVTALPKLNPADVATVNADDLDIEPGSSAVGLVDGGEYSVETLALGLFLVSGNDAANTIARLAGGDKGRAGTIEAMNAEATRLGAKDTKAVNANGLDDAEQWTSAYDLALIGRAAFNREDVRKYAATPTAQIPGQPPEFPESFQIQNDNKLLQEYEGAFGGKTGFTDLARHTFVGVAERGDRRLIVTLMRGEIQPQRPTEQAGALLDWGFEVAGNAEPVGELVKPKSDGAETGNADAAPGRANALTERAADRTSGSLVTGLVVAGIAALLLAVVALRIRARRRSRARNAKGGARRGADRGRRPDERGRGSGSREREREHERDDRDRERDRDRRSTRSAAYAERTARISEEERRNATRRRPESDRYATDHRDAGTRASDRRGADDYASEHHGSGRSYREDGHTRTNGRNGSSRRESTGERSRQQFAESLPLTEWETAAHRQVGDLADETQQLSTVRRSRRVAAEADTEPRPRSRSRRSGPSVGVVVVPGPEHPRGSRPRR